MKENKIYITEALDEKLRAYAAKRFGYGKGSISKAAEEAIRLWAYKIESVERALERISSFAAKDKRVVAVLVFGSYARKESGFRDVDVAILAGRGTDGFRLVSEYTSIAGTETKVDVLVMNDLPLDVQSRIFEEGYVLLAKDKDRLYDYNADFMRRWNDFKHIYSAVLG